MLHIRFVPGNLVSWKTVTWYFLRT